jgi:hypothetical protein
MVWPHSFLVIMWGGMGLSLNPVDVWKLFSDGRRRDKEQIALWLEQAAAEARQIADIWLETAKSLPVREQNLRGGFESYSDDGGGGNLRSYSRLEKFYDFMSSVFAARADRAWQDSATNTTAQVLMRRNEVKALYEKLYGSGKPILYVDQDSRDEQLDDLQTAIAFLNREAAALEVLARRFRASA